MCGIAGFFSTQIINKYQREMFLAIHQENAMRGPDSQAIWENNQQNIFFSHNRLSIQDITIRGKQPMCYKHFTITYNGEIYNFKMIKEKLECCGYHFVSESDTEVFLKAFYHWGDKAIEMFEGQFAFAIWNDLEKTLIIGRDRFGEKPLYYFLSDKEFWFSSYLPSLVRHLDKPKEIDEISLHYFFSMQGVIPAPNTPFKKFKKLKAGHIAYIKISECNSEISFTEYKYFDLQINHTKLLISEEEAVDLVRDSLYKSISLCSIADTDIGVWLSGGLDSSLITAILAQDFDRSINTFSLGFKNAYNQNGNEFKYSDYVAQKYKTKHHKFFISSKELIENIVDCQETLNEPMMSHDLIGHYILSKYTAKNGIKVALSGLGADEVWLGYSWYEQFNDLKLPAYAAFKRVLFEYTHNELTRFINPIYISQDFSDTMIFKHFEKLEGENIEKAIQSDISLLMVDDPVKRADSTGMRHAVEVRTPFLNSELIKLSMSLPIHYKYSKHIGKYVMKKIAERYFSNSFIHREKGYFPVPEIKYTLDSVKALCFQVLTSEKCKTRGIYNNQFIWDLLMQEPKISHIGGNLLWQLTCFELWLQQFDVKT